MIDFISYTCIIVGIVFWFCGTSHLLTQRSVLYKLHSLSVSDTLGSMSIVFGLLLKIPKEWPLLLLALVCLALWNTMFGYVLAYCSSGGELDKERGFTAIAPGVADSTLEVGDE